MCNFLFAEVQALCSLCSLLLVHQSLVVVVVVGCCSEARSDSSAVLCCSLLAHTASDRILHPLTLAAVLCSWQIVQKFVNDITSAMCRLLQAVTAEA